MTQENETEAVHPLLSKEVGPIRNWHEWLEYWNRADNYQWMESLLHTGFNVPLEKMSSEEKEYDELDRYIFYFSVADGWAHHWKSEGSWRDEKEYDIGVRGTNGSSRKFTIPQLRRRLATKAFDILCLNLFRVELRLSGESEFYWSWERHIASKKLFPVIVNFFRIEKSKFGSGAEIINLSQCFHGEKSHNEQHAVNFLLHLVEFMWECKNNWITSTPATERDEMIIRVNEAKPWMIEILAELGKLDKLRRWILDLDKTCLSKIKEIAMRNRLTGFRDRGENEDRFVSSLDEACYAGSKAAWFLKEHELMQKESKRLEAIRESERAKWEVDRRREAIREAEKAKAEADRKLRDLKGQ